MCRLQIVVTIRYSLKEGDIIKIPAWAVFIMSVYMIEGIEYLKLDEDDILEIIIEHFQDKNENIIFGKGILLGTPTKDLRFVGVLSTEEAFESARDVELIEVDNMVEYNGFHSFVKRTPQCWLESGKGRLF